MIKKMKVLIVYPRFYVYGGGEILVVRLCNYLTKSGITNSILTTEMIPEVKEDLTSTDVIIEKNERASSNLSLMGEINALKKGLKKHETEFDVINIHNFPAEIAGLKSSRPVVWMCNEPELHLMINREGFTDSSLKYRIYLKLLYLYEKLLVKRRFSCSVVSDDYNAKRFREIYKVEPHIINYGIDTDFFSKMDGDICSTDQELSDKFIILHVGMLTPYKNQLETLKSINALKEKIPNIVLVFAGGGYDEKYKNNIDNYIEKNQLEKHVIFKGHIERKQLKRLFYKSDLLMHPIKPQGGWLSPFEILCTATPIIVSKEMTASYIIEKENIGTVADNYTDSILDIFNNRQKYIEMAEKGKDYVLKTLSWDTFSSNMLDRFKSSAKN